MKKIVLTAALCVGAMSFVLGQQTVPQNIVNELTAVYPQAGQVEWHEEDGIWEAEFVEAGTEVEVKFDAQGKWSESEQEINVADLPQAVRDKIAADYGTLAIKDVQKNSSPYDTRYEVELKEGNREVGLLLDKTGTVIEMGEEIQDGTER